MRPAQSRGAACGVGVARREGEGVALVGHGVFGVAAVEGIAGELRRVAEVLPAPAAVAAPAAGVAQPGHADAVADPEFFDPRAHRGHGADDLVADDQGQFGLGEFAVDDVQVGAADAAGVDPDEHLLRAGRGDRDFQRLSGVPGFSRTMACMVLGIGILFPP